ncbi:zinc finger CCCH domain-containing protein 3 isoform X2 [Haemaphysalis longicornis]
MSHRSSDYEKKALQDEISYLSRLIDRHQGSATSRYGAQTKAFNRYKKVNECANLHRRIVCAPTKFTKTNIVSTSSTVITNAGSSNRVVSGTTEATPHASNRVVLSPMRTSVSSVNGTMRTGANANKRLAGTTMKIVASGGKRLVSIGTKATANASSPYTLSKTKTSPSVSSGAVGTCASNSLAAKGLKTSAGAVIQPSSRSGASGSNHLSLLGNNALGTQKPPPELSGKMGVSTSVSSSAAKAHEKANNPSARNAVRTSASASNRILSSSVRSGASDSNQILSSAMTTSASASNRLVVNNRLGVQISPPSKPSKRSLSTIVHKSRYTLKKLHSLPSPDKQTPKTAVAANVKPASFSQISGPMTSLSSRTPIKRPLSGRYVYRRSCVPVDTSTPSRGPFVASPREYSGRATASRLLVSKYKLVRNGTKTSTPVKSPSANLVCLGARRIVKKYKVNNVSRSRTSLQRPSRPQFENRAAISRTKQSWPPPYSNTHYFSGQKRKSTGRTSLNLRAAQAHYIKIGSITYKASRNKLSRTSRRSLSHGPPKAGSPRHARVIVVRGATYSMDAAGKTLRRISRPGQGAAQASGRSRIDVGGRTYVEWKPGVLSQTPSAETRNYLSRTVNRSIQRARTVNCNRKLQRKSYCIFFNRFGRCNKGTNCAYIHDPEKVAVCTRFLRGTCKVSDCPFSHKIAPEKMPVCSFFLRGRCINDPCPYRHVKVSAKAEVCREFAVQGFCAEGLQCRKQHILICPDYAAKKECPRGNRCYLKHHYRPPKRKREEKTVESTSTGSGTISTPSATTSTPVESQDLAGCGPSSNSSSSVEGEQTRPKMSQAPAFIPLESCKPPVATPPPPKRRARTGIRIRPNFLS